ncbi:hypothetical protein VU01_10742 [Candidatus Electrothrix marina]|uniref:Uncharacterized protein n=1 Tax=Candidatus Electrothrix marina TaxID=1859130 RepID=A0A3S3QWS0_9BACT|nr:hypothetical protein VU00_12122 [Candidatus Electrothrix marina]RWX51836.1 hypothetical protein VU01_10742 [Candidatus Electrothrix marina]
MRTCRDMYHELAMIHITTQKEFSSFGAGMGKNMVVVLEDGCELLNEDARAENLWRVQPAGIFIALRAKG